MKAQAKKTKRNIYVKFNNDFYVNVPEQGAVKLVLDKMNPDQKAGMLNEYGWKVIGDFDTPDEAISAFIEIQRAVADEKKQEGVRILERKQKEWEELKELEVIPATVSNIKIVLSHLNQQNWGSWSLPKLSIGYSAHQYDCDGTIATTITLDKPISDPDYDIVNERKFKTGGKRGHLKGYTNL